MRISGSNAGYTMFRGSVKGTGYPLHSPVSPSLPLPCVNVCHHISAGVYSEMQTVMATSILKQDDCHVFSLLRLGSLYLQFLHSMADFSYDFYFKALEIQQL